MLFAKITCFNPTISCEELFSISLVVQWLRIQGRGHSWIPDLGRLHMGMWVWNVGLSPCATTTELMFQSLRAATTEACTPGARAAEQEKPLQ